CRVGPDYADRQDRKKTGLFRLHLTITCLQYPQTAHYKQRNTLILLLWLAIVKQNYRLTLVELQRIVVQHRDPCLFRFSLTQIAVPYTFTEYLPQDAPPIQCADPVQLWYPDRVRAVQ